MVGEKVLVKDVLLLHLHLCGLFIINVECKSSLWLSQYSCSSARGPFRYLTNYLQSLVFYLFK